MVLAVGANTRNEQVKIVKKEDNSVNSPFRVNLALVMNKFRCVGWLLAFLTFLALIIQAIIQVSSNEKKDFDLDFVCEILDAPIIAIILSIFASSEAINIVVSVGLAHTATKLLKD